MSKLLFSVAKIVLARAVYSISKEIYIRVEKYILFLYKKYKLNKFKKEYSYGI